MERWGEERADEVSCDRCKKAGSPCERKNQGWKALFCKACAQSPRYDGCSRVWTWRLWFMGKMFCISDEEVENFQKWTDRRFYGKRRGPRPALWALPNTKALGSQMDQSRAGDIDEDKLLLTGSQSVDMEIEVDESFPTSPPESHTTHPQTEDRRKQIERLKAKVTNQKKAARLREAKLRLSVQPRQGSEDMPLGDTGVEDVMERITKLEEGAMRKSEKLRTCRDLLRVMKEILKD